MAALSGFTTGNNGLKSLRRLVEAKQDLTMASWGLLVVCCRKIAISPATPSTSESRANRR
jgi:hypothetical protein